MNYFSIPFFLWLRDRDQVLRQIEICKIKSLVDRATFCLKKERKKVYIKLLLQIERQREKGKTCRERDRQDRDKHTEREERDDHEHCPIGLPLDTDILKRYKERDFRVEERQETKIETERQRSLHLP